MSDQINRHPIRPDRRLVNDVQPHRWGGREIATVSAATHQQLEKAEQGLHGVWQHLGRMVQTAGHSWAAGEHDVFLTPLHRAQKFVKRYAPKHVQRWQVAYFTMLFIALAAIPLGVVIRNDLRAQRYVLSAATQKLVGAPVAVLDKQISFNTKTHTYQYNPGAANGIKAPTDGADKGVSIGGSKYYGVDLAAEANKGQTFTDAQTKLSFSLLPQFGQLNGKHEDGHVVYPIDSGQVVYTLKSNGLKEDVVLSTPTDSVNLSYKLQLPADLEAKLLPDGSVAIYSADPSLFGNITYGSDKDQASVQKARVSGKKTNLVFQIPAPIITESGTPKDTGKASFSLKDDILTVSASKLDNLSYPISIDPSVVISSANSFSSGNPEDNSSDTSGGNLARIPLSGATLNAGWTTAGGTSFTTGRLEHGSVVLNGFAYVFGGNTGGAQTNTVYYAPITGPGTIGTWNSTTTTADSKDYSISTVAYNGYLYMLSGNQDANQAVTNVWYAAQCTGSNVTTAFTSNCAVGSTAGTISSWNTTTNLNTGRIRQSAVVYNGYVYVIGGCTSSTGATCTANIGIVSNLEYSKINSDGSLGLWTVSSNAALARYGHQSAVYNGNLYVMGGCTLLASANCSGSAVNDAWYAPLNPTTGAPGTWVQTNVFSGAGGVRMGGVATTYDGYMYEVGGCINVGSAPSCNSSTPLATSSYAPIYANGQLGPWSNTTALSTALRDPAGFEYGGYLYILGGCSSAALNCGSGAGSSNTSTSAKIDTVGALANFVSTATNNYPAGGSAHFGQAGVATGGYIYQLGGTNGVGSTATNDTYYALVCTGNNTGTDGCTTAGGVGTWHAAANTFTGVRTLAAASAYGGYLYISGGAGSGAPVACKDVQYTLIGTSGAPGTWQDAFGGTKACTTVDFTPSVGTGGAYGHSMVAYNGYMYLLGGLNTNNTINIPDVQYATICDGFTTTAAIGTPSHACGATAGQLSGFQQTTAFPNTNTAGGGMNSFGAIVFNGYMYTFGGRTNATANTGVADIQSASINANGTISSWTVSANALPSSVARYGVGVAVKKGFVYLVDGAINSPQNPSNAVWYASLTNGVVGTWNSSPTPVASNPAPSTTNNANRTSNLRNFALTVAASDYLYIIGGCDDNIGDYCTTGSADVYPDVQSAPINNGGSGDTGAWTTNATTVTARFAHGSLAYNGFMYVLGGSGSGGTYLNSVQYAAFNSDGSIGTWNSTSAFNNTSAGGGFAVYNGYIYKLGGRANSVNQSDVQYAAICTGSNTTTAFTTQCTTSSTPGTLSSWNYTDSNTFNTTTQIGGMSTARGGMGAAAYGGYLYAFGGCNSFHTLPTYCNGLLNTIEYAPINANGTIGSWTVDSNNFTTGRSDFASASYNGYLYIAGGCVVDGGSGCTTFTTDVQYAKLGSGSLASNAGCGTAWCFAPSYATLRESPSLAAGNGYLYLSGGKTTGGFTTDVQYAPLLSNGAIGVWNAGSTNFTTAREAHASLVYNGRLYISGGCGNNVAPCNPVQTDVQYAGLQSIMRIAHYSRFIDTASTVYATTATGTSFSNPNLTFTVPANNLIRGGRIMVSGCSQAADNGEFAVSSGTSTTIVATNSTASITSATGCVIATTGGNVQFTRYLLKNAGAGLGQASACISVAAVPITNFLTPTCGQTTSLGTPTSITKSIGRYALVFVTVDDTANAVFPDTASSASELDMFFRTSPQRRLRGGQTFIDTNSATANQLDTEGP